jgi:predicted lactoylglutathione lyase
MTNIEYLALEVDDTAGADVFYDKAFGLGDRVRVRESQAPTSGFRGFALSLVVSQPGTVDSLVGTALDSGATVLKPVKKGFWGYGGTIQAPDGTIWKLATSAKKDTGPATRRVDSVVLLLGVDNVKATKQFYVDHGMVGAKSYGSRYVEFDAEGSPVTLALYGRRAAAKDVGVDPAGTGSHRIAIVGDAGSFTDPDGFVWETASG